LNIPQAISPNDDGFNDVFKVLAIENFSDSELEIYNRWGDKVYSSHPYMNDWYGQSSSNNGIVVAGTYFYKLILYTVDGEQINRTGFLELRR